MKIDWKRTLKYLFFAIPVVIAGIVVMLIFNEMQRGMYEKSVSKQVIRISNVESSLYSNCNKLYVCTNDGTSAFDGTGGLCMSMAYNFDKPKVISAGEVSAICEQDGYDVYVITANGIPYSYTTEYPIIKMCVAEDGTTAVLLDNGTKDIIRMYSTEGNLLVEIGTTTMKEGFPVDISLSPDGMKLVTLYYTLEGDDIVSKVTFYNRGDVGRNYIENIVGQKIYDGTSVYAVEFLNNNYVGIMLENGFTVYSTSQIPKHLCDKVFSADTTIKDILFDESYVVSVTEKNGQTKLSYWDFNGGLTSDYVITPYEAISLQNSEAMVLYDGQLIVFRANGTIKANLSVSPTVCQVYSGGGNSYFLVENGVISVIELEK